MQPTDLIADKEETFEIYVANKSHIPWCQASFAHMINSRMGGQGFFPLSRAGHS